MMNGIKLSPLAEDFVWASGIEDTFVPQVKPGHRPLDEYQLMGHYEHWREDIALVRELGIRCLRWGVPWYRVEPQPGEFDWGWTDEVLPYMVEELGITPILDLMHYGTPFWMTRSFVDKNYPKAVASYAAAFTHRYRSLIRWYTPLNEPLVNALYCGKRGLWPPYLRGDTGYIRVMLQLVKGITATVEAIKEIDPEARMVHVEATGLSRAIRQDLEALAVEEQHRGYVAYDLLTGRVRPDHPLFSWLVRSGASIDDLSSIAAHPIKLDVLGLNFYPQWSTQHLFIDKKGRLAFRQTEDDSAGFAAIINDYYTRYQAPILITETSAFGSDDLRSNWLRTSIEAVKFLRSQGVPVHGYTWFPLFTMIDWRYRHETGPVEQYRLELGLYRLRHRIENGGSGSDGEDVPGRWARTPLVEQFRSYVEDPLNAVGQLASPPPPAALRGTGERTSSEEPQEQPVDGD